MKEIFLYDIEADEEDLAEFLQDESRGIIHFL